MVVWAYVKRSAEMGGGRNSVDGVVTAAACGTGKPGALPGRGRGVPVLSSTQAKDAFAPPAYPNSAIAPTADDSGLRIFSTFIERVRELDMHRATLVVAVAASFSFPQFAAAAPITYRATYTIAELVGTVPANWGALAVGDEVSARLVYDIAIIELEFPDLPGVFLPGPLVDYSVNIGLARIFFGELFRDIFPTSGSHSPGSDRIFLEDSHPGVSPLTTALSPFIDDFALLFACPQWSNVELMPPTLDCGDALTGGFSFELLGGGVEDFPPLFGRAVLTGLERTRPVPEPGALSLFGVGLLGQALGRRRRADGTARSE
jgi:hypothetical protein